MKDETVWLLLDQMAKLFGRDRTVITRHINNIFKDKELEKNKVSAKFAHTTQHGAFSNKTQTRGLDYLEKAVKLIDIAGRIDYELKDGEAQSTIKTINSYASALNLFDDYDHRRLNKPNGNKNNKKIT